MIAACGQMIATTMEQAAGVWEAADRLAEQGKKVQADLLVLPEIAYPAYWLESAARYRRDDIERTPRVLDRFSSLAARHKLWLVLGFVEEQGERLYNSAAVFDRGGRLVGVTRKNFLWACDHQWFTPGEALSVFDTEFGKMGVLICADARLPEIPATLVSGGAELIIQPTAWVNTSKVRRTYRNVQPDFLIRARAIEFGVPFICSSKSGREGTVLEYVGQSQIVSAEGAVLARAQIGGEEVIAAEVELGRPGPPLVEERFRDRLLSRQPPYRPPEKTGRAEASTKTSRCRVPVQVGAERLVTILQEAGGRVAKVETGDLEGFAAVRCQALDGAQVILAQGRVTDDLLARTRAAENRVFVIVASDAVLRIIDPEGSVLWRHGDWNDAVEIDLAQADVKRFTPETDIWSQRRVECYRF
jgi:predicted amidohydrolase